MAWKIVGKFRHTKFDPIHARVSTRWDFSILPEARRDDTRIYYVQIESDSIKNGRDCFSMGYPMSHARSLDIPVWLRRCGIRETLKFPPLIGHESFMFKQGVPSAFERFACTYFTNAHVSHNVLLNVVDFPGSTPITRTNFNWILLHKQKIISQHRHRYETHSETYFLRLF